MKRLKNQSGFTLAETLLAVLILLLVSVIVATGMPAARNAYNKVILGANAQAMLSNAVTSLRDELGTAWKVECKDATTLEYFDANTGAKARICKDGENSPILIKNYISLKEDLIHDNAEDKTNERHLVPDSNTGMYVTFEGFTLDNDNFIVTVNGLKVCKQNSDNTTLLELKDDTGASIPLEIRLLSKDVVEPTA